MTAERRIEAFDYIYDQYFTSPYNILPDYWSQHKEKIDKNIEEFVSDENEKPEGERDIPTAKLDGLISGICSIHPDCYMELADMLRGAGFDQNEVDDAMGAFDLCF